MAELPQINNDPSPVPPMEPSNNDANSEQQLSPSDTSSDAPRSSAPQAQIPMAKPGGRRRKLLLFILLILVVIIAGALVLKSNNKPVITSKKDIPLINVGLVEEGGVPKYPINYSYSNDTVDIALQLFEGLVGYQNQNDVVPLLATSWSNPNNTTWVFNIRHGVKFHSGRTLTAADVKYSLDYAVANQSVDGGNSTFFVTDAINQVNVTGTYQVTITTNSPDAVLLNQLSLIGIIDSKAKLGDYNAGTGPYIVKPGTSPTTDSIDLVAFNNYWGSHVYTRAVDISLYNDTDKLTTDTANGKFDLAGNFSNDQLSKIKQYQPFEVSDQGLNYIGLNTERTGSPLQSLAARQAIAYALNIPAILKAGGLKGLPDSQIVPLILPGHNPALQNTAYNPAKAKQLLATVNNTSTALSFAYPPQDGPQATEITKELDAVGFNVKPISVSDFNAFLNDTTAGKYDLFTESDTSATVDGLGILTDLLENNQDYDNPQIDNLIAAAGTTLDSSTRIKDMQQVATIVGTNKPIIPLYTQTRVYALTKPYVIKADLPSLEPSIYFWKVYQN